MRSVSDSWRVVGTIERPWPDVRRIAVLRGGGLGDLLSGVPAIDALAAAYPQAEILLLAPPSLVPLLTNRPSAVSRVVALPPARGVYEPAGGFGQATSDEDFYEQLGSGPIDLGVQIQAAAAGPTRFCSG
jgi:hypothetical protein